MSQISGSETAVTITAGFSFPDCKQFQDHKEVGMWFSSVESLEKCESTSLPIKRETAREKCMHLLH